jgi:hypothetical protein
MGFLKEAVKLVVVAIVSTACGIAIDRIGTKITTPRTAAGGMEGAE